MAGRMNNSGLLLDGGQDTAGLRVYMASVYVRMAGGVMLSAISAWLAAHNPVIAGMLFTSEGLTAAGWFVTLAPLGLVLLIGTAIDRFGAAMAGVLFLLYAALVGLSLGGIFMAYTGSSIVMAFLGAAVAFAVLAAIGSATRCDLSGVGTFFMILLIGLIAAMVINLFVRSSAFDLALSGLGILLFAGLTAYDVQRLKRIYYESEADGRENSAVLGALALYLDLLNLFLSLLRLTGQQRR